MKKLLLGALLLLSMTTFAQGNSDLDNWENGNSENAGGANGNGNSPASAPIDDYVLLLALVGSVYVLTTFISLRTNSK